MHAHSAREHHSRPLQMLDNTHARHHSYCRRHPRCPVKPPPPTPHPPAAAAPLSPQCSALEEQVEKHHRRHEALSAQLQELHAKLSTLQQQQHQPATTRQAASFLLFFLLFINFWGMVANFQTGWCWPWMAAKPAGSLWLKQLLGWAVPFTNTLVIVIFCMQAVKAAWTCLRL